ncbi:MAG: phytoene desaturase [Sphingomonadales bacterium]|nr:phytoene desaturase [Sphingomonadales bacterium]
MNRRACVIGAGFGGLALAIRLQAAGVATTLIEARDRPGGCAYAWEREGFTFDAGPGAIPDPAAIADLWQLSGHDPTQDVDLLPVAPFWRLNWPDGAVFDLSGDEAALRAEIARLAPGDLAGYEEFCAYAAALWQEASVRQGSTPVNSLGAMAKALSALARQQPWRSVQSMIGSFVKSDKLREALGFQTLLAGGNPLTAGATALAGYKLERDTGLWWAKGGTQRLIAAMARQFQRIGGTLVLHDPVLRIHTLGNRATEVETASGWKERFDAVASNADVVHTYRDLLSDNPRGRDMARKLAKKRFSPSLFVVHFGLEGTWPGIPHNMVLFGPRWRGLLDDVFDHGVLPQDQLILLSHPTVTDPSVAPPGKSTFRAMVPVANQGKLPIDWEVIGPMMEQRVLVEVGRRLIPDIDDRIVTRFHYAPRDFALDLNAHMGSAFSLEALPTQSLALRPHSRDDKIANLYLVGAAIHPGAGVPAVLAGAQITAGLMLEELL